MLSLGRLDLVRVRVLVFLDFSFIFVLCKSRLVLAQLISDATMQSWEKKEEEKSKGLKRKESGQKCAVSPLVFHLSFLSPYACMDVCVLPRSVSYLGLH